MQPADTADITMIYRNIWRRFYGVIPSRYNFLRKSGSDLTENSCIAQRGYDMPMNSKKYTHV